MAGKISVVMATYNGERFLPDQLASLAAQSRQPDELIVVDDASQDGTPRIVRDFAKNAPFPVVVAANPSNIGWTKNFTRATSYSTGDIILFCDQDDLWDKDKIAIVEEHLAQSNDLLLTHDLEIIDKSDATMINSYFGVIRGLGLSPCIAVNGCAMALRRELLMTAMFPEEASWTYDAWLADSATALKRRHYIEKPLIKYRIHENNAVGRMLSPKPWLKATVYRFSLPPFTNSSELDYFLEHFPASGFEEFRSKLEALAADLNEQEEKELRSSIKHREAILAFLADQRYRRPLYRSAKATALFVSLSYRAGGRVRGFLKDVLGRRGAFSAPPG